MQYPFSFTGPQSPDDLPKLEKFLTRANFFRNDFPPMLPTTRDESSTYPPRHDPYGGYPVNPHLNVYLRPQDTGYPEYGNYNGQNGGGPYNPQVQGGDGVDGNGKITMGPEINGANLNIGDGKAGGGDVGGEDKKKKKKKKKDNDSSNHDGQAK